MQAITDSGFARLSILGRLPDGEVCLEKAVLPPVLEPGLLVHSSFLPTREIGMIGENPLSLAVNQLTRSQLATGPSVAKFWAETTPTLRRDRNTQKRNPDLGSKHKRKRKRVSSERHLRNFWLAHPIPFSFSFSILASGVFLRSESR